IPRRVAALIVDALKVEARLVSGSHVSKEVAEIMPALAHGDAAAAIPFKILPPRFLAASTHGVPAFVEGVVGKIAAAFGVAAGGVASARDRVGLKLFLLPAIAPHPDAMAGALFPGFEHRKASITGSDHIGADNLPQGAL